MNINFFSSTYAKLGTKAKNTMNRLREWRFCLSEVRRCESSTSLFFMKWNEGALHIRKPMSELCLQPMDLIKLITASLLTFSLGRAPSIRLKNIYLSYEVWNKTRWKIAFYSPWHSPTFYIYYRQQLKWKVIEKNFTGCERRLISKFSFQSAACCMVRASEEPWGASTHSVKYSFN